VAVASVVTAAAVVAAVATAGKLLSLIVMIKGPAQAGPFFVLGGGQAGALAHGRNYPFRRNEEFKSYA